MRFIRKIFVGVASLTLIIGAYMLYRSSNKTPLIKIGSDANIVEVNIPGRGAGGGKIGSVEVPILKKPRYKHRGPDGQIDREFGFDELVRTVGDVWDVNKPWMKIYQRDYQFNINADHGTTELETIVGRSEPKDATFKGNVTIEIIPLDEAEQVQSTIYLDSLIFLSEKSRFSAPGYVKLISQNVNLDGRGLEFVYNDRTQRLDYMRLTYLDELRIKDLSKSLFSKPDSSPEQDAAEGGAKGDSTVKPEVVVEKAETGKEVSLAAGDAAAVEEGAFYKCVLSEMVLVETPDEIIFAREEVSINDIFWSKALMAEDANSPADANAAGAPVASAPKTAVEKPNEKEAAEAAAEPEEMIEITVKSGNGMLFVPVKSKKRLGSFERAKTDKAEYEKIVRAVFADANERSTFVTERIDYNSVSGDAVSAGPCELVFHTGSIAELDANEASVPVTVSAAEAVRFFKKTNQAVFTGAPFMRMPQTELSQPRDATFSGSKFIVNLPEETPEGVKVLGDIVATGPVQFIFHVEDSNAADANEAPVPVSITAFKEARFVPDSNQVIFDVNCLVTMLDPNLPAEDKFTLTSPKLVARLPEKGTKKETDVMALGPVRLEAYVDAFDSNEPNAVPLPATVTASKQARFRPGENLVTFEGNCRAVAVREDPNFIEQYALSSQEMAVVLPEDSNRPESKSVSNVGIERFSASGGVVTLGTKKMVGEKQISGIDLRCRQFDYDPNAGRFTADGPGVIILANTEPPEQPDPNEPGDRFSLKKPCWATIENYDKLTYFENEKRILAEAQSDGALVVRYLPIEEDGQFGDLVLVTANHVEAILIETAAGDTELATLTASGGITYQAKDNEFIGGKLFYDHAAQRVRVTGSDLFPCQLNGALADEIVYDLETDKVEADLVGPGALQLK